MSLGGPRDVFRCPFSSTRIYSRLAVECASLASPTPATDPSPPSGAVNRGQQTTSRFETGRTPCPSAPSNPTAAAVARFTASSFAWPPRPAQPFSAAAAPRAATRSPSPQASATSRVPSRNVTSALTGAIPLSAFLCSARYHLFAVLLP